MSMTSHRQLMPLLSIALFTMAIMALMWIKLIFLPFNNESIINE
ncbi:hypothetical protein [Proteus cibi]|nr:hypothetical protein [Proteus cibi]